MHVLDAIEILKDLHATHGNLKLSISVDLDEETTLTRGNLWVGRMKTEVGPDEINVRSFQF